MKQIVPNMTDKNLSQYINKINKRINYVNDALRTIVDNSIYVEKVTGSSLVEDTEIIKLQGLPNINIGTSPPLNPSVGDLWIDTSV